jgi:fibronectin-binding autotransporter adhesin
LNSVSPDPSANLRKFIIPSSDSKMKDGSTLDLFFRLNGAAGAELFGARIIDASAANWYRLVRPWSFQIKDIFKQRGDVSILNNVINPDSGEKAVLHYVLPVEGMVTINVFNLGGDLVSVLHRGRQPAGEYSSTWDGRNMGGRAVVRGIYFIRVVGPNMDEMRKVMVVR